MLISKFLTASITLAIFAVSCAPALSAAKEGDLFPLKTGNWWTYRATDENGKVSKNKHVVVSTLRGRDGAALYKLTAGEGKDSTAKFYSKQGDKTMLQRLEFAGKPSLNIDFIPAKLVIYSKIRPGSIWQWTGTRTSPDVETERWQVFPVEKVKVPAGEFDCVRVGGLTIREKVMVYQTRWFAPNVGLVKAIDVKGSKQSKQELSGYHVN